MRLSSNPASKLKNQNTSGTVALTGASPQTGHGLDVYAATGVQCGAIDPYSLSAYVTWNIKALNLTYTAFWEGSDDGATWYTIKDQNNAAGTVFATGTGSDVAGGPLVISAPNAVAAFKHVRLSVVTGGSATGVVGHDNVTIAYNYQLQEIITE